MQATNMQRPFRFEKKKSLDHILSLGRRRSSQAIDSGLTTCSSSIYTLRFFGLYICQYNAQQRFQQDMHAWIFRQNKNSICINLFPRYILLA
jgi:hypothetical protein